MQVTATAGGLITIKHGNDILGHVHNVTGAVTRAVGGGGKARNNESLISRFIKDESGSVKIPSVGKNTLGNTKLLDNAQKELDDLLELLGKQRNPPATAIGAVDPETGRVVAASSGDVPRIIHPELAQAADDLGGLGVKTACGNTLGRCAEFRAANELLLANPNLRLRDIKFTPAVRPRTPGRVIDRCDNCIDMFGVE